MVKKEELQTKPKKKIWRRVWFWVGLGLILGGIILSRVLAKKPVLDESKIGRGTVTEELVLSGSVTASEYANLSFQSSGELVWMGVKEGDWVKKGQYLARLDTVSLNAAYQQALANLRSAEATLDRVYDDVKDHDNDESFTQKETRVTAEVAKDKAWDAVVAAKKSLDNANLKAPFDGLITKITNPFSGINTTYAESQIEILNPDTLYFQVTADQTELVDIKEGERVIIVLDTYADEEITGVVDSIGYTPKTGETSIVYEVKIKFENLDNDKYRVGMTGDVKFPLNQKDDVLYVDSDFIKTDKKGRYLLMDKNKKVYVEMGLEGEDKVEVISDQVKEGELIYD